jgi:protein phosphatase
MSVHVAIRTVGTASHTGHVRATNEDRVLADDPVFAVADGMGGHRGGAEAAATALGIVAKAAGDAATAADRPDRWRGILQEANQRIAEMATDEPELRGMATTCTLIAFASSGSAVLAHVGDSRAYLLRAGTLTSLTEDQTYVAQLVREGVLSLELARRHPARNVLSQALGQGGEIAADVSMLDIEPGDRFMLCTDGLSTAVERAILEGILQSDSSPQGAAERLIERALAEGGEDNVSVIVVDVWGGPSAATLHLRGEA